MARATLVTEVRDHLWAMTPQALLTDPHVSGRARDLYDYLDLRAGSKGHFYADDGQREIARHFGVSVRTVRTWETQLEDGGYIWRQRSKAHATSHTYWIIFRLQMGAPDAPDEVLDRMNDRHGASGGSGSPASGGSGSPASGPRARASGSSGTRKIPPQITPYIPPVPEAQPESESERAEPEPGTPDHCAHRTVGAMCAPCLERLMGPGRDRAPP